MKKGKIFKTVLIILLVVIVAVVGIGYNLISNILYPDVLVSGTGTKKVVVVGDSITFGQGVLGSRETDTYPAILAELLGDEYQTLNYGLCNCTLLSSGNMPYVNEDFATESLVQDANIVIIMLGTNDSKPDNWNAEQYEKEYITFVQKYQNLASAPDVYIMLPPRVFKEPEDTGDCNNAVLTEEVIPAIECVAEATGAKLIDLYSVTEDHADWYSDGLHPNAEGNRAIAQAIHEKIVAE